MGLVMVVSTRWLVNFALIAGSLLCGPAQAGEGSLDPVFAKVPFEKWFSGAPQSSLHWSARVLPVRLSNHQRLLSQMQITLDGAEAAKRRGEGQFLFFFQLTDSKGQIYQDHSTYELEKVESGLKSQDLVCTESAFVLPGDYQVFWAIFDTATGEHAAKKDKLHVAQLKSDPLSGAWRDLPSVEFLPPLEKPDTWFLPTVKGALRLPVETKHPVRIEVVMNLTPSEMARRLGSQDRNLSVLFPALKALAQLRPSQGSVNVTLLDLERRRVAYQQESTSQLDWDRIKPSLAESTSGSIDVKALEQRQHSAAFFIDEVGRRLEQDTASADAHCAVIVLSSPMVFDSPQVHPEAALKPVPGCPVFYIRYQTPFVRRTGGPRAQSRRMEMPGMPRLPEDMIFRPSGPVTADQLGQFLRPLEPHVLDVAGPDDIRKALATVIAQISVL